MKGDVAETIVKVVIMLAIIAIIVIIAYFYIVGYYLPDISSKTYIAQLCPEWVKEGCTQNAAEPPDGLRIEVDNSPKYLSTLCEEHFNVNAGDFALVYENCKKICIGCPE